MANKTFADFSNQGTPLGSDFVVGYRGTAEQRYTLNVISGLISAGELTSPLTTKGDIWGYDTDNARIPVGSNGQVLIADSTQALGVRWGETGTAAGSLTGATNIGAGSGVISGISNNDIKVKSISLHGSLYYPSGMADNVLQISGLDSTIVTADNIGEGTGILKPADTTVTTGNVVYGARAGSWYAGTKVRLISDGTTGRIQSYYTSNGKMKMVRNSPFGTYHAGFASEFEKVDIDNSALNFKTLKGTGNIYLFGGKGVNATNEIFISGSGGGGTTSPLTTKGDLYGFDTENARIPVGSSGQVLTADPDETLGGKWADSSSACPITSWVEAFELDGNGDLMPADSNCINDTMWILNNDYSLSLRANEFRYNTDLGHAYTQDVSF